MARSVMGDSEGNARARPAAKGASSAAGTIKVSGSGAAGPSTAADRLASAFQQEEWARQHPVELKAMEDQRAKDAAEAAALMSSSRVADLGAALASFGGMVVSTPAGVADTMVRAYNDPGNPVRILAAPFIGVTRGVLTASPSAIVNGLGAAVTGVAGAIAEAGAPAEPSPNAEVIHADDGGNMRRDFGPDITARRGSPGSPSPYATGGRPAGLWDRIVAWLLWTPPRPEPVAPSPITVAADAAVQALGDLGITSSPFDTGSITSPRDPRLRSHDVE